MASLYDLVAPLGTRRTAMKRKRSSNSMETDQDVLMERNRPKKNKKSSNSSSMFVLFTLPGRLGVQPGHAEGSHSLTSESKSSFETSQTQPLTLHEGSKAGLPRTCHNLTATRHPHWWLPSGDIILHIETVAFKVHKTILADCSSVFESMFTLSAPSEEDCIENTPFVQLYDSSHDWSEVLKWIYMRPPNDALDLTQPSVFQTIVSYSRIASKYDMPALMEFAQEALLKLYSPNLLNILENETLKKIAIQYAVDSINLSRRCDMPAILPVAFFLLASADTTTSPQQVNPASQLQPSDMYRLQIGSQACEQAANSLLAMLSPRGDHCSDEVKPHIPSGRCCSIPERLKQLYGSMFLCSSGAVAFARMLTLLANQRTAFGLCGKCALEVEIWFVEYLDGLSSSLCGWFRLD